MSSAWISAYLAMRSWRTCISAARRRLSSSSPHTTSRSRWASWRVSWFSCWSFSTLACSCAHVALWCPTSLSSSCTWASSLLLAIMCSECCDRSVPSTVSNWVLRRRMSLSASRRWRLAASSICFSRSTSWYAARTRCDSVSCCSRRRPTWPSAAARLSSEDWSVVSMLYSLARRFSFSCCSRAMVSRRAGSSGLMRDSCSLSRSTSFCSVCARTACWLVRSLSWSLSLWRRHSFCCRSPSDSASFRFCCSTAGMRWSWSLRARISPSYGSIWRRRRWQSSARRSLSSSTSCRCATERSRSERRRALSSRTARSSASCACTLLLNPVTVGS
mmetsp:Transcript_49278/g.100633  ORF Transcript_49278/g.100633 Transcript_49278/m.100633 type:complete len:331 (-) Transcript_49278:567-1559(-)